MSQEQEVALANSIKVMAYVVIWSVFAMDVGLMFFGATHVHAIHF